MNIFTYFIEFSSFLLGSFVCGNFNKIFLAISLLLCSANLPSLNKAWENLKKYAAEEEQFIKDVRKSKHCDIQRN